MSGEASAAFWAWVEALRAEHLKFSGLIPKEITALDAWVACWAQKEAELAALRAELQKVRSAAISGMDAATQHGHSLVQQAARLKAESNPDALESERAANALLTEQLQKAEADLAALRAEREQWKQAAELARHDHERLTAWVDDLQSGMYVNCVYCGHRYGPGETTPVSMSDALKAHVEQCPQHPMSALRAENERLNDVIEEAATSIKLGDSHSAYLVLRAALGER